jgi:hypothetical protein
LPLFSKTDFSRPDPRLYPVTQPIGSPDTINCLMLLPALYCLAPIRAIERTPGELGMALLKTWAEATVAVTNKQISENRYFFNFITSSILSFFCLFQLEL